NSALAEPIKVTTLPLKTDERRPGQVAAASDDWTSRPVVQVENTSGKAIRYLVVEVSLPGADSSGRQPLFLLGHGRAPGRKPMPGAGGALQPGAKVNLTVSRNSCSGPEPRFDAGVARPPQSGRATSQINVVVFEDGTAWYDGMLYVADASNPSRWNPAGRSAGRAASNPEPLLRTAKASYSAAPASAQESECGDKGPVEFVYCCDNEFFSYASATLLPNRFGMWQLIVMTPTHCPDGSPCHYNKAVPCDNGYSR
ncbi:MAG TPA: hypothetical protein VEQ42_11265, partial [Pyrinomonadaceae bacterium]|nr:hypothetical protein [Pyrinomonadaceae bacterium]